MLDGLCQCVREAWAFTAQCHHLRGREGERFPNLERGRSSEKFKNEFGDGHPTTTMAQVAQDTRPMLLVATLPGVLVLSSLQA